MLRTFRCLIVCSLLAAALSCCCFCCCNGCCFCIFLYSVYPLLFCKFVLMTIIILLLLLLGATAAATPFALGGCLAHVQALVVAVHGLAAVAIVVATQVVLFPLGRCHFRRMPFAPFGATILEPNL